LTKNFTLFFATLFLLCSCTSTGSDIKATSEIKRGPIGPISKLLIVHPEQNRKDFLNNQAYTIAKELEQQLSHAGIQVSEYTVKAYEVDSLSKLMDAAQTSQPSHILSVVLESGKVASAQYLQNYILDIKMRPASDAYGATWHYRAEVYAPTSTTQEVAAHAINQMKNDHLIE
jgi:hypothetical protein